MSITRSRVDGRASREYRGGPAGLFEEMRTATKLLVRDVLAAQSGQLSVAASEEGATVRLDGTIIGSTPMPPQTVPGGMHTVTLEKEGFVRFTRDVEVRAHDVVRVTAALRPSEDFVDRYRGHATAVRRLGWAGLAVGVLGLGGSGALYVTNAGKASKLASDIKAYNQNAAATQADYDALQQRQRSLATMDAVTIAAAGVGVVAATVAVVALLTGDDPARYDRPADLGLGVGRAEQPSTFELVPLPAGVAVAVSF
jgi:hypothetical protein